MQSTKPTFGRISFAGVFALQDKVTRGIAAALALRLTDAAQDSLGMNETNNPAAYEAFLRGWEHLQRSTADDLAKAVPYFEEAIRLDLDYAYAALALLYFKGYNSGWATSFGITSGDSLRKSWKYLRQAQKHPTALSHQTAALIAWVVAQTDTALCRA